MKYQYIVFSLVCLMALNVCSCSLLKKPKTVEAPGELEEYFPVNPKTKYTYRVELDNHSVNRILQWQKNPDEKDPNLYFLTDGKDFTKAYEITRDAVLLKGLSLIEDKEPQFYKGANPCLKIPVTVGNQWLIDAILKTETTIIRQTG